ncbi:MAG: hypothetical protein JJU41_00455 [Bacteroidetes bacterium]|nr:hypothetical protein [Bacteroidota bacterium]MCH8524420.1 hypothetical protein [Balneolales bacterium]
MKTKQRFGLGLLALLTFVALPVYAQVDLGVDINSRYVWRGTDFGSSPSIQPEISYTVGNLTIGTWAAFATNGNPAGSEIDFFASYEIETKAGSFELIVTDYTFPEDPSGQYFSVSSHFVELGVGYSGTESLPLTLFTGVFVTNDDDYSIYTELGYSFSNVDLSLGFTPGASAMYGTNKAGIVSAGLGTSREVQLSDSFSITLSGQLLFNPYQEDAYFLFGFSF